MMSRVPAGQERLAKLRKLISKCQGKQNFDRKAQDKMT